MKTKKRKVVELNLGIIVVAIAITVIAITMLKYNVEGEKDMPYIIKQMVIISTANGENTQTDENKWNINIYQNNDIYLEIARNTEYKSNETLKSVRIENIQITPNEKYTPKIYTPDNESSEMFKYVQENEVLGDINYAIDTTQNIKERKITTEGGILALSVCTTELGIYQGNDEKMRYDGTLLNRIGITKENITTKLKFNLIIETESSKKYKAEISLTLPEEDITQTGIQKRENTEVNDIIFKRIN